MEEILATVDGALQDELVGLASRVLILAEGDGAVRNDFTFGKWAMAGTMNDARTPNVMLRPRSWRPTAKRVDTGHRDATAQIEIGYEFFGADLLVIQRNVTLVATALAQVVDALVDFATATATLNGGRIIETEDPIDFVFGQFVGPTSHGFVATITVIERSFV